MTRDEVAAVVSPFLVLVHTVVEVVHKIVDGTALHRGVAHEDESLTRGLVIHFECAHVGVVAALLRTDILVVFVAHVGRVFADELTVVAVGVVLHRTSTIIFYSTETLGHLHLHTEFEHLRSLLNRLVGSEVLRHEQCAVGLKCIGHRQLSLGVFECEESLHHTVVAIRLMMYAGEFISRILPYGETLLQSGSIVVVGGSTPEVGSDALAIHEHLLAIDIEIVNPSRPLADGDCHACCLHLDVSLGLGELRCRAFGCCGESGVGVGLHHLLIFGECLSLVDERFAVLRLKVEGDGYF